MTNKKDELITASELARRLNVSAPYIAKQKDKLKISKCMFGKKYYFRKSALLLGKDPDNPHESHQQRNNKQNIKSDESKSNEVIEDLKPIEKPQQKKETTLKNEDNNILKEKIKQLENENKKLKEKIVLLEKENPLDEMQSKIKDLQIDILATISDSGTTKDLALLNGLKAKATILKEFELAISQGIKNKSLQENNYTYDEIIIVINQAVSIFRNALLNLANNYAVNLEGMTKKQIKDFVSEDINSILEDFEKLKEKFKDE